MRRIGLWIALVVVTLAGIELVARISHPALLGEPFDAERLAVALSERLAAPGAGADVLEREEVIHPYLGYVSNPKSGNELVNALRGGDVSDWGLNDDKSPLQRASRDRLIVGVFGGSVAHYFSQQGIEALGLALGEAPRFEGREFVVVRVALAGWKQPQQLFALSYLLALGAHFDLVVNLDGFNEVTLAPLENRPKGVSPFFPRNWFVRTQGQAERGVREAIGEIAWSEAERARRAEAFRSSLFARSAVGALWWGLRDRRLGERVEAARTQLVAARRVDTRFVASGPPYAYDAGTLYDDLAAVWRRSSLQMHQLAVANGIEYFHFLQPNQYVPDAKPLHADELELAWIEDSPYRPGVERGYPLLRAEGERLREAGVRFTDLTTIFANVDDPLYHDICCHLNARGNALLGARIGAVIAETPASGR